MINERVNGWDRPTHHRPLKVAAGNAEGLPERHVVIARKCFPAEDGGAPEFGPEKRLGTADSYPAALRLARELCGHGEFWIESSKKSPGAKNWTPFVPEPVGLMEVMG